MERRFHVVFTGRLHFGFNRDETVEKMALLFQLDRQKVAKLLSSGRPTIIKQGLSWGQAQKYRGHLEQIGLRINIVEADVRTLQPSPKPVQKKPAPARRSVDAVPLPAPAEVQNSAVDSKNPTGSAEVERPGSRVPPFKVEKSHGWLWIKESFRMFFKQPLKWAAMTILLSVIIIAVAFIPYLGGLLISALTPIFLGGMMLGAQRQKEGGGLKIDHLFHGFNHSFSRLLLVGFFSLLLGLTAQAIVLALSVGRIMPGTSGTNPNIPHAIATLIQNVPLYLIGPLIIVALSIPLMMGLWFAPCLVTLDDRTASAGFSLSFLAVRINFVAFLIYGLVLLLLGMLFIFLYGAAAALFSFLLGSDHTFLFMLLPMLSMVLLGIPLAAIIPLSIYTGYRDIFLGQEKQPAKG